MPLSKSKAGKGIHTLCRGGGGCSSPQTQSYDISRVLKKIDRGILPACPEDLGCPDNSRVAGRAALTQKLVMGPRSQTPEASYPGTHPISSRGDLMGLHWGLKKWALRAVEEGTCFHVGRIAAH